jgi:hypothetical protein
MSILKHGVQELTPLLESLTTLSVKRFGDYIFSIQLVNAFSKSLSETETPMTCGSLDLTTSLGLR